MLWLVLSSCIVWWNSIMLFNTWLGWVVNLYCTPTILHHVHSWSRERWDVTTLSVFGRAQWMRKTQQRRPLRFRIPLHAWLADNINYCSKFVNNWLHTGLRPHSSEQSLLFRVSGLQCSGLQSDLPAYAWVDPKQASVRVHNERKLIQTADKLISLSHYEYEPLQNKTVLRLCFPLFQWQCYYSFLSVKALESGFFPLQGLTFYSL